MTTMFAAAFLTRSPAKAMAIYLIFQFAFLMPLFGTGFLTILEFCTYYTIAVFVATIDGWLLALVMNVPSVFMNRRIDFGDCGCCIDDKCQKPIKAKISRTENGARGMKWGAFIYRVAFGSLIIMLFAVATLSYELIPAPVQWVGMLISILCLVVIHVIFYFVFRYTPPGKPAVERMRVFKSLQAVYLTKMLDGKYADMTLDVVLYLAIFYVPMTLAFCCTSMWAPWWWQFWTCLIIFAFYFVLFIIAGLTWLKFDCETKRCEPRPTRCTPAAPERQALTGKSDE